MSRYFNKQLSYPSLMTRMFAAMIDCIFFFIVLMPFFKVTTEYFYDPSKLKALFANIDLKDEFAQRKLIYDVLITNKYLVHIIFNMLFQLSSIFIILVCCWSYFSTTPGKKLFSIIIVDKDTFSKPTIKQSIIRFLSYIVSIIPCFLGIFWIGFNKKKRGWHDIISNTIVVYK